MAFVAVLLALLLEQLKPLPAGNPVHDALTSWARWTGLTFNAGKPRHALVVWAISVLGPVVLTALIYLGLRQVHGLLGFVWTVVVLYLTLGFRQFSHYFTDIREALERADERRARESLRAWRHLDASELPRTELLRHVIEHALLAAHRHVFGVFFWFLAGAVLGLGPAGAVLYRMAEFSSRYWAYRNRSAGQPSNEVLMAFSRTAFVRLDQVPAQITAFGFAVVGNFEEAIDCWRAFARHWSQPNDGAILAAAAGAMGVSLGGSGAPVVSPDQSKTFEVGASEDIASPESTPGLSPTLAHLQSVVALVWRSVVLWMLLLALLSVARILG